MRIKVENHCATVINEHKTLREKPWLESAKVILAFHQSKLISLLNSTTNDLSQIQVTEIRALMMFRSSEMKLF